MERRSSPISFSTKKGGVSRMNTYYFWFGIFIFVTYLILTDHSVAYAVTLLPKIIRFQYEKQKWWLWNNPQMPWAKFLIWRNSLQIAKSLEKELNK
jgi:hypothetical protein